MSFTRTGFILYTRKYRECVSFYQDILELPTLFESGELTCFAFGASYLMIEPAEQAADSAASSAHRSCLRMNVANIRERSDALIRKGITVDYQEHAWGTVAKFVDPDGNLCALKDDETFERQVSQG